MNEWLIFGVLVISLLIFIQLDRAQTLQNSFAVNDRVTSLSSSN